MKHLSDPMCLVPSLPSFLLFPSVLSSETDVLALVSVKADLDLVVLLPGFLNAANTHFLPLV